MSQLPYPGAAFMPPAPGTSWGEIEPSLLQDARGPVPAFPLDLLPPFWRQWVADSARSAGAPVDYVAQALLAAVAGLAGCGARVRITPHWGEPLVLWQAMVGPPSSGKSSAMAPLRRMVSMLEPRPVDGTVDKPRRLVEDAEIDVIADTLDAHPRGAILWRDEASDLLARLGCVEPARPGDEVRRAHWLKAWSGDPVSLERGARRFNRFAVNLLTALRPERLAELSRAGEELVSRFLFTWPHAPAHASLTATLSLRDDEAWTGLGRVAKRLAAIGEPVSATFDEQALLAFDKLVERLALERREAEGIEAAWLGKGPATVARLAGVLHLLAWSRSSTADPPATIGREQAEGAIALWADYFRPHTLALFHHQVPSDQERRARRVVRWLQGQRHHQVSREDVRSKALRSAINADQTDQVLYRLQFANVVARDLTATGGRGRPPNHWLVNPALLARPSIAEPAPSPGVSR